MLLFAKFSGERFFCFALHKQNYTEYILKKNIMSIRKACPISLKRFLNEKLQLK